MTRGTEHDGGAPRWAAKGMAGGIIGKISFRLDNPARRNSFVGFMNQQASQQLSGHDEGRLQIKRSWHER
jgi:hypothetical protein